MLGLHPVQDTTLQDYSKQATGTAQWSTDDARPARLVNRDVQHDNRISQQCHVLILCRGDALSSTVSRGTRGF